MTQGSREALIDLLFLSLYLDNHLSLAEDDVLGAALDSLGWESTEPREKHIWRAFSKARDAASCEAKTHELMDAHATLIQADGEEAAALTWLSRVLGSDGLSYSEKEFLGRLETRFYPKA